MQLLTLGRRQERKCDHNILGDSARHSNFNSHDDVNTEY